MRETRSCEHLSWNDDYPQQTEETGFFRHWYVRGVERLLDRLEGTAVSVERVP